jgi:hypothetical protein
MLEKILLYLPNISESDLLELMNVIDQSNKFNNQNKSDRPNNEFELKYARYLGTKDPSFLLEYKEIVEQACFNEFLEWYEYLSKNILRKDVQAALDLNFEATNTDWETEVKKSEIFGWAFQVTDYKVFVDNIEKVKALGEVMVNFFNSRKPLSILDEDYFESDHAQLALDSIDRVIINNSTEELKEQLETEKVLCMIEVYGWENRFNPILLSWIYTNQDRVKKWC